MRLIQNIRSRFDGQRAAYRRGGLSMLLQNTLAVMLSVIGLSFFENAALTQVLLAILSGFAFSLLAPRRNILHGVVPVSTAALFGLLAYFLSPAGRLGYPTDTALAVSLAALGTITGTAAIAALLGTLLRARIRKLPLTRWFRSFTLAVLIVFVHAQVVMPVLSPVLAEETTYTPGDAKTFLEHYDPEAAYLPKPLVTVDPEPVQRIPQNGAVGRGAYEHLTPEEQELIEATCAVQGCTAEELAEALEKANEANGKNAGKPKTAEEPGELTPEQKQLKELAEKQLSAKELTNLYSNGKLTDAELAYLLHEGFTDGTISAGDLLNPLTVGTALVTYLKNNPDVAKALRDVVLMPWSPAAWNSLIDTLAAQHSGIFAAAKIVKDNAVRVVTSAADAVWDMGTAAWEFAKEHPLQTIGMVGMGVVLAIGVAVGAPIAIAATAVLGVIGLAVTAVALGVAYATGGTDGMMRQIFSPDTMAALAAGDLPVLIGRMPVELGAFVLMNLPENPAAFAKIPAAMAGITRLSRMGTAANLLGDMRTAVNVLKTGGKITANGGKFLLSAGRDLVCTGMQSMETVMAASPDIQVLTGMMHSLVKGDPYLGRQALAFVNTSGDMLAETGKVFGDETLALGGKVKEDLYLLFAPAGGLDTSAIITFPVESCKRFLYGKVSLHIHHLRQLLY